MKRLLEKDESTLERVTKQLCTSNENNATCKDYNQIVQETTDAIVQLFIRRAKANDKLGKFTDALCDAEWVMAHAPTLAQGYLLTATIYSHQGKEQKAMAIIQQGLVRANTTQEQRKQLEDQFKRSKQQWERRVDFVFTQCIPVEIIAMIWFFIGFNETLVETMIVSKAWRNSILNSPLVWKSVRTFSEYIDAAIINLIPSIGRYVQHLSLHTLRRYYYSPHITYLSYMGDGIFCNLKSLFVDARVDANLLSMALYKVKYTLTKLEVVYDMLLKHEAMAENAILPLPDILDICPDLQELKYVSNGAFGISRKSQNNNVQEEEKPCGLRRLDLFQHLIMEEEEIIKVNQLHKITERCHHLRHLSLRNFNVAYLDMLNDDCPELEHVFFINHESDIPEKENLNQFPENNNRSLGIRTVSVVSEPIHIRSIGPYLSRHCKTLVSLSLCLNVSTTTHDPLDEQQQQQQQQFIPLLPAMKNLVLSQALIINNSSSNRVMTNPSRNEPTCWSSLDTTHLIQQCPGLEKFTVLGGMLYKRYFQALRETTGSNLKYMSLQTSVTEPGALASYLCHEPSKLGLLQFRSYFLPAQELCLDALSEINTLEELRLCFNLQPSSSTTLNGKDQEAQLKQVYWDSFMVKLQTKQRLKELALDGISFIRDQDLIAIAGISSLECVLLQRLEHITNQGLKTMVDLFAANRHSSHCMPKIQALDCRNLHQETTDYVHINNNPLLEHGFF